MRGSLCITIIHGPNGIGDSHLLCFSSLDVEKPPRPFNCFSTIAETRTRRDRASFWVRARCHRLAFSPPPAAGPPPIAYKTKPKHLLLKIAPSWYPAPQFFHNRIAEVHNGPAR